MLNNRQRLGQKGLVSIVITAFLMLMLGLLVIGFGKLVQREQRQALDRQLSAQAQYAAESGVNDAIKAIKANTSYKKTECAPGAGESGGTVGDGSVGPNSSYPCLLVDNQPTSLDFSDIDSEQSESMILDPTTGVVGSVQIAWQAKAGGTDPADFSASIPALTNITSWGAKTGMLRVEIVPIPSGGSFDRAELLAARRVYFLYPLAGAAGNATDVYYSGGSTTPDGTTVGVDCNTGNNSGDFVKHCVARIKKIVGGSRKVLLRIRSIYRNSSVSVSARSSVVYAGNNHKLTGEQVVIDTTGKAGDVLRRQRVHVDITPSVILPEGALETMDSLCKRLSVAPAPSGTTTDLSPECALP